MQFLPALERAYPIASEGAAWHKGLETSFRSFAEAFPEGLARREFNALIERCGSTPLGSWPSLLAHPLLQKWRLDFIAEAQRLLASSEGLQVDQFLLSLTDSLKRTELEVKNQELAIPGTTLRVCFGDDWTQDCYSRRPSSNSREQKACDGTVDDPVNPFAFVADITQACTIIKEAWPEAMREIQYCVTLIVPHTGSVQGSFTTGRAIGAVFVGYQRGNVLGLADALLHEARHNRMFLTTAARPIYTNGNECDYWSPWRQCTRPFRGIVFGLHAFLGLGILHGRFQLSQKALHPLSLRRVFEESDRGCSSLRMLKTFGQWLPAGKILFDDLYSELHELLSLRDQLVERLCPDHEAIQSSKAMYDSIVRPS